jgi:hypothetical protein
MKLEVEENDGECMAGGNTRRSRGAMGRWQRTMPWIARERVVE